MQIQGLKYTWKLPSVDQEQVLAIAHRFTLSLPLARTLLARGFTHSSQIEQFLFTSYEKDVAPASLLKDADRAVDRILYAIDHQEKILVFGDYDVDGITSSSLMMACLLPLGAKVNFYLPNRAKEGYGLSTHVVERAAHNNYKLIITVDNGTTAFDPARVAKERGIDLIITDHHRPHDQIPEAYALVNPHQKECRYPFKGFAGVGVIFKVISLLYEKKGLPIPEKAYELLLLGTIADVVPLLGENRFWVRHGLQWIREKQTLSLRVLKQNAKLLKDHLSSIDIGFRITPQINALGRLEDPRQGVQFLLGSQVSQTEAIGKTLFELNEARKQIERAIFEEVNSCIVQGKIDISKEKIIIAGGKQWSTGVIGLVASRLVGAYGRPAILLHMTSQGKAKGSCRSIQGLNMFEALQEQSHLLDQFGGHAMAAGLALDQSKVPELKEGLEAYIAERLKPEDFVQKMVCDATIQLSDVTKKLITDMELLEPFGAENPQPLFHLSGISLAQPAQLLKGEHVKCFVHADGVVKPLIFFNRPDIYTLLQEALDDRVQAVVQVVENEWQDRKNVELIGLDMAREL